MVEHAELIDTSTLHEPKGIKESSEGQVYVSNVASAVTGPFNGTWRKLNITDLNFVKPTTDTQTYVTPTAAVTLSSDIVASTTGSISAAATFSDVNKNTQELYLAVANLLTRLAEAESNINKLKTLLTAVDGGLKTINILQEQT